MSDFRMLKYPLFDTRSAALSDHVAVKIPAYSAHHFLGMQNGVITLWCLVDAERTMHERHFHLRGRGHVIGFVPNYIGTVFDREFVWHVFEQLPEVKHV